MKTNLFLNIIFSVFGIIGCSKLYAQEVIEPAKETTKETQEITIRKNGKKDTKVTIEITDNSILVNGKPLAEFKEDGITINNRKMIIREGDKMMMDYGPESMSSLRDLQELTNMNFGNMDMGNMMGGNSGSRKLMLGVITETKEKEGVVINEVVEASAAKASGLQEGDIIYKVDDVKIETPVNLATYIKSKKGGDKVKIYFTRDGKKKDTTATLESANIERHIDVFGDDGDEKCNTCPPQNGKVGNVKVFKYKSNGINDDADEESFSQNGNTFKIQKRFMISNGPKLGLKIQDTETENGVKVMNVETASTSETAGLKKDDIIVAIGDKTVNNTDEAREALNENKSKSSYTIKVKRNGADVNLTVKIPKKLKTANL